MIQDRITRQVNDLQENEVFVFGSNTSGRHGKGAAKTALKWGARWGKGVGLFGRTYAIPTVNASITGKLSLKKIQKYVDQFITFAEENPQYTFLVTAVGCGLAGWTESDIAPLFTEAATIENISLPREFWKVLNHK